MCDSRFKFLSPVQAVANSYRGRWNMLMFRETGNQPAKQGLALGPVGLFSQQAGLAPDVEHLGTQLVLGQLGVAKELLG